MLCATEQTKVLVSGQKYVSLNLKAQNFTGFKPFMFLKYYNIVFFKILDFFNCLYTSNFDTKCHTCKNTLGG